ncbi:MAG: MmgE/PrpD family protein [Candidatus Competibacterales bacterium]|nr:MmgE/PrpD family protein [Candidatus Competibacterales bacterium]
MSLVTGNGASGPFARTLGEWISGGSRSWSSIRLSRARDAILDVTACMLAGSVTRETGLALAVMQAECSGDHSIVGRQERLAESAAALVNGTAAHSLDYDDNFEPAFAHASAVLVPALYAVGETRDASGRDLLDAYLVGLQVMARVGFGINPVHRMIGWHATSTVGTIGVAAGCARVLGLTAEQATSALSIATSSAAGSTAQFGTDVKPLHAGFAARAGVLAARLAAAGVRGSEDIFEHRLGFRQLYLGGKKRIRELRDRYPEESENWPFRFDAEDLDARHAIETHGLALKRWPNCGSAHAIMQAFLDLLADHGLGPEAVRKLRVTTLRTVLDNLRYTTPATPVEARFSLPWALACLLSDGELTLSHFEPAALGRPDLLRCLERIEIEGVEKTPHHRSVREWAGYIEITTEGGELLDCDATWPQAPGTTSNPLDQKELADKFLECAARAASAADAGDLLRLLQRLESVASTRSLMAHLRGAPADRHPQTSGGQALTTEPS